MPTLAELMADYDAERIAEIERDEARNNTPEVKARREAKNKADFEREIRQGIRDADGVFIIPEDYDDKDTEDTDE